MKDTNSMVQFYRGPKSMIDKIENLEDGRLFFSTDTKQIMMDCNFVDSLNNNYNKRITFGGSTGIVYGKRGPFQEGDDFNFKLSDLENAEELPSIDDLILNDDGCFYRVTEVFPTAFEVGTTRLTLQGSGGTGTGGGRFYKTYVTDAISYFSINDEKIPISFGCYYEEGTEALQMEIIINDQSMGSIGTIAKEQVKTVDLTAYKNLLKANVSNTMRIKFTALDSEATSYMTFSVFLHDIYVEIDEGSKTIDPQADDCDFTVYPFGGTGSMFMDRMLVYELRAENSESPIWEETYKTSADIGEKVTYYIPHQQHGTYILTVYLKVGIQNTNQTIVSQKHQIQIPFYDADQSAPLITTNTLNDQYTQYSTARVNYMITYNATSTSDVNLVTEIDRGNGRELVRRLYTNVNNNEYKSWDVLFNEVGIYYLTIELNDTEYYKALPPISVTAYTAEDGGDVPVINTDDAALMLYLSAAGRMNDETSKDVWRSNYRTQDIYCDLEGFNWITNGWITDENGNTSLHLTNGAKVTVPYSPFKRDSSAKGAERNGRVIEIDFKISNIRDLTVPGITCVSIFQNEENGVYVDTINTGIQIYGNKAQLFSVKDKPKYEDMSGRTTIFKENERIHLAYIINSLTDSPSKIVYTMLNGVVSSLSLYDETDQFVDESNKNPSSFIFDSSNMDIDIYNIRVYDTSKKPNFILENHFADNQSIDEAVAEWRVNNVISSIEAQYNSSGAKQKYIAIDLDKVKDTITIPYMIFEDGRQTSDKKDEGWENDKAEPRYPISTESRLPTGKKDFRHMTITYVDPQNPSNNIAAGTIVTCYAQGTSSLEYPVKNLRIYFKEEPYQLFDDVPAVSLFTLKADYMESSSSHNTGTANALNELYSSIGLKSPATDYYLTSAEQEAGRTILTAIMGKPIICFYRPYQDGCSEAYPYYYQYIGRYNFNYDKATHEIFGFESLTAEESANGKAYGYLLEEDGETLRSGFNTALEYDEDNERTYYRVPSLEATDDQKVTIAANDEKGFEKAAKLGPLYEYKENKVTTVQCWEFLNNTASLVGFRTSWDEEVDKVEVKGTNNEGKEIVIHAPYQDWVGAFECRYPEHTDEASTDKRALARVVNWLASTNRHPNAVKAYLESIGREINEGTIKTEQDQRLRVFTENFNDYFDKDFVTFYYILTEFLVMMDSRGKNMMFACYDADPDNNTGHWLPIFYDMDTMLGLNNSGQLIYSYDVEDDQANLYNLAATYESTQYSVLWCNFKDAFYDDIQTMYQNLRKANKFTLTNFLNLYNKNQGDAWEEVYLNEDADYKYIDPLVNNYQVEVENDKGETEIHTAAYYLYAAQGSRSQHRAYWLQRRFAYLDSKYDYAARVSGTDASVLNVRLSSEIQKDSLPFNATYTFTPKYNQYVTLSYQNSGSDVGGMVGPVRLYENNTTDVEMPIDTAKDQEAYFYGIENMKDIGLQADKYYQKFIISRPLNVTRLDIGSFIKDWANDGLGVKDALTISDPNNKTAFLPFLEYLNLQNCTAVNNTLTLSQCPYLQELYCYGTNIPSVNFFEGGNLKHIEMSASTTSLTLKGQLFFDTFTKRTDEEVEAIRSEYTEKIAASIRKTMTKNGATEEEIQSAIDAIELTEIQKEHLTFENYDRLNSLRITNCPLVDSKNFIMKLMKENDDGSYRTNLRNFRMEDINWTITKDECVLMEVIEQDSEGNTVTKTQIKNIPLLDTLVSINGINNTDNTVDRQEAGNDYFAGTITIENDSTFGVSEYIFYELYEKLFPNLKFVYTENDQCTKAYFIGINNALNRPEARYSKKIAATEIDELAANLIDWFTPTKDAEGNWDATHAPESTKTSTNKYDFKFIGWSLDKSQSFNEDDYVDVATQLKAAQAACVILVDKNEDETYKVSTNNNFTLSIERFDENQELNFYPVYLSVIRSYRVNFYWKKNNTDILLGYDDVKYGSDATPPLPPQNLELPEEDKRVTYIYPFTGYSIPYTKVIAPVNTYAQFGTKVEMADLVADEISKDYFEITSPGEGTGYLQNEEVALKIKPSFTDEAIIIPAEFPDPQSGVMLKVGMVKTENLSDIPQNLRRIYFEKNATVEGNRVNDTIRVISNNFMQSHTILEYCDLPCLNSLEFIGASAFQDDATLILTDVGTLPAIPHTVSNIGMSAFNGCSLISIKALPNNLTVLGAHAFESCVGIQQIDVNNTQLTSMPDQAFYKCSNLTIKNQTIDCLIETVGDQAFGDCSKLILNFVDLDQQNKLKEIKFYSFGGTPSLNLANFPSSIERIGTQGFSSINGAGGILSCNIIPKSVQTLDYAAFMFRKLADEYNGIMIIENPDINIHANAFVYMTGITEIWVPSSVDLSVAPWNTTNGFGAGNNVVVKHIPEG